MGGAQGVIDLVGAFLWAVAGFMFAKHGPGASGGIAVTIYALICAGALIILMI